MLSDLLKEQDFRTSTPPRWRRIVDGFNDIRSAVVLGATTVVPAGQYAHVGIPQVGKIPAMAAVARGQRPPQAPGRGCIRLAQHPGHDALAGPLDGQPKPDLALFPAHKGPHLIQFQCFPLLFLRLFGPQAGQRRQGRLHFFYPTGHRHPRDARHAGNAALRVALAQQFVNLRILHRFGHGGGVKRAWCPQPLHGYLAWPPALPLHRIGSLPQAAQKCCVKAILKIRCITLNYSIILT